jgi:hypothetical protein
MRVGLLVLDHWSWTIGVGLLELDIGVGLLGLDFWTWTNGVKLLDLDNKGWIMRV